MEFDAQREREKERGKKKKTRDFCLGGSVRREITGLGLL